MERGRFLRDIFFPQGRFFYGWIVVGVAFLTLLMNYGVTYSFGVFFVSMFEEFGWSRAMTAAAFSINQVVYGCTGPLCGLLFDRFGARVIIPLGACLLTLGLLAASRMGSIWEFYLYYGLLVAIGANLIGAMTNGLLIQQWFVRRRGMALGMAVSGMSAGMLVVVPITQYLVSTVGWRSAYQALAAAVFLAIVPLAALLHRRSPQAIGSAPDGVAARAASATGGLDADRLVVDRAWAGRQWTVAAAARTRRFWLLAVAMALGTLGMQTLLVHQIAFLTDVGYGKMAAALTFGSVGVVGVVFRVVWGAISDRIGREHAYWMAAAAGASGVMALIASSLASSPWLVWVYTVLFAMGLAAPASLYTAIAADLFQGRRFGAIYGLIYVASGIGGGFGPWFAGYTHDLMGSYYIAFTVAAAATLLAAAAIWLASPRKVRLVAGKAAPLTTPSSRRLPR